MVTTLSDADVLRLFQKGGLSMKTPDDEIPVGSTEQEQTLIEEVQESIDEAEEDES